MCVIDDDEEDDEDDIWMVIDEIEVNDEIGD